MPALYRTWASDRAACLPWVFPEVGLRDREVSFTPKDRHRQPSLSGPPHTSKHIGPLLDMADFRVGSNASS
jgi:hypothetical protein